LQAARQGVKKLMYAALDYKPHLNMG